MEDMILMNKKEQHRAEVIASAVSKAIQQQEAAERLGLSVRQVRRLQKAYAKHGIKGLISRKRGRSSNNQLSSLLRDQVVERIQKRYPDFGPTLAHEKLVESDGFKLSLSFVRRLMIKAGIWQPKIKKEKKIHPRRKRRPRYGELVQIDGSPHDWFEGRAPKCCLIAFI